MRIPKTTVTLSPLEAQFVHGLLVKHIREVLCPNARTAAHVGRAVIDACQGLSDRFDKAGRS